VYSRFLAIRLVTLVSSIPLLLGAQQESSFRDSQGKRGNFTVDVRQPVSKSGVLVYFHGSGSTANYAAKFSDLSDIARQFDLTPVALQAPDGAITWAEKDAPSGRIPYAHALLKAEVFGKFPNLDANKSIFVGISAGATFISGDFLPSYINEYGGGAVLLCGGSSPIYQNQLRGKFKNFKMFVAIHPTDFLFSQTVDGVDFWRSFGLTIKSIQPPGKGHCGFDIDKAMKDGISFILGK
jgi:hypothetical protein